MFYSTYLRIRMFYANYMYYYIACIWYECIYDVKYALYKHDKGDEHLLGDKQDVLIGGQTGCPYWDTNMLHLLGDKQVALTGGQTGCPYWGTNRLPLLGEKQNVLTGGHHLWSEDHFPTISFAPIVFEIVRYTWFSCYRLDI